MCKPPVDIILVYIGCTCFTIILLLGMCYPYSNYYDYNEYECNITHVDYPTIMPTYNHSIDWIKCNCGNRCSSVTPCIKLYSSIKPELMIQNEIGENEPCTFTNLICFDPEYPQEIHKQLIKYINIAENYINSTITCYYDDAITNIYIEGNIKDAIINFIIIVLSCYICCGCLLIISLIKYYRDL